jgi:hypothetical protein
VAAHPLDVGEHAGFIKQEARCLEGLQIHRMFLSLKQRG